MAGKPVIENRVERWREQWNNGTMFQCHFNKPHPKLTQHYDKFIQGKSAAKVFFPLCGDSLDIYEMGERGHNVIGVECCDIAIKTFYKRHDICYEKLPCEEINGYLYKSNNGKYKLYCCDIFDFNMEVAGQFDVIVDFGCMGALLRSETHKYVDLMKTLMKPSGRLIVESFVYDLDKYRESQPICFTTEHLERLYGASYVIELIDEGPNPYTDGICCSQEDLDAISRDYENYPEITGTSYFIIKHLHGADKIAL